MLNRRRVLLSLLTLGGTASFGQESGETGMSLSLEEAPIRSAIELLLKGFGANNFQIDNHVVGFVTLQTEGKTLDVNLGRLCRRSAHPITYTRQDNLIIVKPEIGGDAGPALKSMAEHFSKAKLPSIEGVPARVAGTLVGTQRGNKVAHAILELGNPPDSQVAILGLRGQVMLGTQEATVEKIDRSGIVLKIGEKQVPIPLAPLVPKIKR